MRNLYKVLGVASSADDQRIKTVFRRRAKKVHPDLNPGSRRAEARFIELMQAYEVLSNARSRAAYDAYLAERRSLSRRRLAHCAGLMMTSFMLTATSVILVMAVAGANVPFRETWQMAVAAVSPASAKATAAPKAVEATGADWTAHVAVAPASPASTSGRADAPKAKPPGVKVGDRATVASSKAPAAEGGQGAPHVPRSRAMDPRHLATAAKPAPYGVRRPEPLPSVSTDESWPPSPPADEPRYSLGASDLR